MPAPTPGRYLATMALVASLGLWFLGTVNLRNDPYGAFRRLGVDTLSTETLRWSRVASAERARSPCEVMILGSSRVVFGFGIDVPPRDGKRVCNTGLGGTSLSELRSVLDVVLQNPHVEEVHLYLDLHLFNDQRTPHHDFHQSWYNPERSALSYYAWMLTSIDAFNASAAVRGVRFPWMPPVRRHRGPLRQNRIQVTGLLQARNGLRLFRGPDKTLAIFESMLDDLDARGIRVQLAIPPLHALMWEVNVTAGVWDTAKTWRRTLVQILDSRPIRHDLWDFAHYHEPATGPVPIHFGHPPSQWFADISHMDRALARLVQARIDAHHAGQDWDGPSAFGVLLTAETLDTHLARFDADRATWRYNNPAQVQWFDNIIEDLRTARPEVFEDIAHSVRVRAAAAAGEAIPERNVYTYEDDEDVLPDEPAP